MFVWLKPGAALPASHHIRRAGCADAVRRRAARRHAAGQRTRERTGRCAGCPGEARQGAVRAAPAGAASGGANDE